jgi:hypothetical protein
LELFSLLNIQQLREDLHFLILVPVPIVFVMQLIEMLEVLHIHTSSVGNINQQRVWKLIGLMHVTFVVDIVWMPFHLKHLKKMNSLNKELQEETLDIFGLQEENVTLLDVIAQVRIEE